DEPVGNQRAEAAMRRVDAHPVRRQAALEIAAAVADGAVEILTQQSELGSAASHDAGFPLEAERDGEIEELEEVEIDRGVALQLLQEVEEAVAAPGLAIKGADHAALRPDAATTPGRIEDEIVDGGAERIAAGTDYLRREAGRGDAPLEGIDLGDDALAQRLDIAVHRAVLELHRELEQRRCSVAERVQPLERRQLDGLSALGIDRRRLRRRRRRQGLDRSPPAWVRADHRPLAIARFGKWIVDGHRPSALHLHPPRQPI